jgi:hypothetical protein
MSHITTSISISRDNILRYLLDDSFYEKNPGFQPLLPDVATCREQYAQSKQKSSCGCGGNIQHMLPCIEQFIMLLEQAKTTDVGVVQTFVEYVNGRPVLPGQQTCVSIYFAKAGETNPQKYEFIA